MEDNDINTLMADIKKLTERVDRLQRTSGEEIVQTLYDRISELTERVEAIEHRIKELAGVKTI